MFCKKCGTELPDEAVYCFMCGRKLPADGKDRCTKKRGNGEGTVFQYTTKAGPRYAAEVTIGYIIKDGQVSRTSRRKKGFKTKKEALAYLPQLSVQPVQKKVTLQDLWELFEENSLPKLSKSKQGHYRTAYNKIKDILFIDINLIDIKLLQDTVNAKAATYYPAKDIKTLLSQLYDRAVAQRTVTVNIAQYIELPTLEEDSPNPFTEEEVKSLWTDFVAGSWTTGYALLMIYTGMMPGELFDLKTDMIDLDARTICGVGKKTKKRKLTPIVLADCIVPVILELLTHAKGEKFLPMREDDYRKEFKAMLARCGCRSDLVPYSCRHTTATSLALENIAMPVIKEVMRHTKITTTERYISVDTSPMLEAVNHLKKNSSG
ncbi:MAG: tyrosine-type recombinase/integrase [Clostridia bacterium]|nr:tyrosine-type recombinase/integrase [Clostridia bacterium]